MIRHILTGAAASAALTIVTLGSAGAGELRVGHANLPNLGNPLCCTSNSQGYGLQIAYDHLVYIDEAGNPQPGLAAAWKSLSPTAYQVRLRPNVKFHNGKTMTAQDIADQLNYLLTDDGKARAVAISRNFPAMSGAKAIDATTLEITTSQPDGVFIQQLGTVKGMDWNHFRDVGYEGYATKPVGTGPYKAITWQQDKMAMEAFKDGWRPGKIDKLTMLALPETSARVAAFQSGQIEIAIQVNTDSGKEVELGGGYLHNAMAPSNLTMFFNTNRPLVSDVRVRRAINHGVNKDEYLKNIIGGRTVATGQVAPRTVRGYQADIKPYAYDPAKAKALLAEAGHPNGMKMVAEVTNNSQELVDVYQHAASDLGKIGVQVELRVISLPDLVQKARALKPVDAELVSFDMGAFPTIDMMRSINALHSCKGTTKWTCFPEIEPTIAAANQELDPKARDAQLRKIAQFYHDMAPALFLHEQYQLDAVSKKVRGWKPVNWVINWHDLTM